MSEQLGINKNDGESDKTVTQLADPWPGHNGGRQKLEVCIGVPKSANCVHFVLGIIQITISASGNLLIKYGLFFVVKSHNFRSFQKIPVCVTTTEMAYSVVGE